MCANKLKLFLPSGRKTDITWSLLINSRIKKCDMLFSELSPATHSFLLLNDNVQGLGEAVHMVITRFRPK